MITLLRCSLVAIALVGCASPMDPTRFYVLAPTESAAAPGPRPVSQQELRVGIRSVELPRYLDRPQIVTRASANRLDVAEFHRWGSPLRLAVPVTLAENLGRLVPSEQVMIFPWGRSFVPDAQVAVEMSRLEGTLGGQSVLAARWRILGRSGEEVATGTSRFTEPSGADHESLVAAQSRLIAALSQDIAEALRRGIRVTSRDGAPRD